MGGGVFCARRGLTVAPDSRVLVGHADYDMAALLGFVKPQLGHLMAALQIGPGAVDWQRYVAAAEKRHRRDAASRRRSVGKGARRSKSSRPPVLLAWRNAKGGLGTGSFARRRKPGTVTRSVAGAPLIVDGRLFVVEDTAADYGGKVTPAGWARVRSRNDAKMKLVKLGFDAHEARKPTETLGR
jgi:hypothetical protein